MSKKKLLEFGLKEADAFQKNFKIIFDRLVRGYKSMMGREPEGLDLLKVKMEAREKALNTTKVVNQKGLTLDPDKPIVGGTQEGIPTIKTKFDEEFLDEFNLSKDDPMGDLEKIVKGEGDTGLPKEGLKPFKYRSPDEFTNRKEYERYLDEALGPPDDVFGNPVKDQMLENFDKVKAKNVTPRPFGDNIRDAYRKAGRSREDATEMIKALDSPGAKQSYEIMEEALGVRLYGDETFEELMQIKETGVHPRGEPPIKKADGGQVPAAPSQLVSESDMILGYRGAGEYQGGRNENTASDTGPGGGATDTGPSFTGDSISGGDVQDLGFIDSGPTVNPNLSKRGPTIISAPTPDPRFAGYTPSGFDPGGQNIFQKGVNLIKKTVTNPFLQNIGLGILGGPIGAKFGLSKQIDMFNKARAIKSLLGSIGPMTDQTIEEALEEETGQTTALYKDGGLASMFVEKR